MLYLVDGFDSGPLLSVGVDIHRPIQQLNHFQPFCSQNPLAQILLTVMCWRNFNMKNTIYSLIGILSLVILSGCGKSGGGSSNNNAGVDGTVAVCPAGAVNTQYGCLNQTGCPVNQGNLNGQCVPAVVQNQQCQVGYVSSAQYGCLQQGSCPTGYGLYNNQCVVATSVNQNQYNGGYNTGYQGGYNPYPNYGYGSGGYGGGYGGGFGYSYCYWFFGQMVCK